MEKINVTKRTAIYTQDTRLVLFNRCIDINENKKVENHPFITLPNGPSIDLQNLKQFAFGQQETDLVSARNNYNQKL